MKTGYCDTCQKKNMAGTECLVLNEMIGKTRPCWAWTDDPDWRKKHKEAVKTYQAGKCFVG